MSFFQQILNIKDSRIYMDYAATTPVEIAVLAEMNTASKRYFANPGSLHTDSIEAAAALTNARTQLKVALKAFNHDLVFTRGGTEACNIAVRHALARFRDARPAVVPHVIVSPIEHSSVYELCRYLSDRGQIELEYAPTDNDGVVACGKLVEMIRAETALVAIQLVNSEVGVIQPLKKITHTIRRYKHDRNSLHFPLVFTDAIQGGDTVDIHMQSLGVDYLALSASKFYGPKSGGILCVPHGTTTTAGVLLGGDQELGIRPGTPDVALAIGTASAYSISSKARDKQRARLQALQRYFYAQLSDRYSRCLPTVSPELCAPHIVHIAVPGYDSDYAVLFFDKHGIGITSQSACSAGAGGISRAVKYLWGKQGREHPEQYAQLRFSFGRSTNRRDIDRALLILGKLLEQTYVRS